MLKNATPQTKGIIYMIICAVLWSTSGIFIKLIPWHPMIISGIRSLLAGFVIWVVLCKEKQPIPIFTKNTFITGVLLSSTMFLFVFANKLTTAANAIVLQSANPVFIMILCYLFYKQRFYKKDVIAVVTIMLGICLFFLDELSPGSMFGNVIALLSAVVLAGTFIFTTKARTLPETMSGIFIGHMLTAIIGTPFVFIYPTEFTAIATSSIIFLGIFQLGIPYVLMAYSARSCPPLLISLVGMVEPILNPIWVAIFIHEIPGPLALLGGTIVLSTLIIWCISNQRNNSQAS